MRIASVFFCYVLTFLRYTSLHYICLVFWTVFAIKGFCYINGR